MALGTSWTNIASQNFTYLGYSGTAYVYAKLNRQDIANNRSYVDLELRIWHSVWVQSYDTDFYLSGYGWLGYGYRSYDAGTTTIMSSQITVNHNNDGTGSVSATGGYEYKGIGVSASQFSGSTSLPTIPRASQPSASPNPIKIKNATNTLTVNSNRKANSFTHTIKIQVGSWSLQNTGVGASTTFNIPYSVIAQFSATSKTATGTITCTTYSGSTNIGTKTANFTLQVDSATDHANIGTITTADTNPTTSAIVSAGQFVYGQSTLQATIPFTVSGSYTELASAKVTCGNTVETFPLSGTSDSITFTKANIDVSSLTVTVTDKRGNSVSKTESWTLLAYQPLTLTGTVGRPSATGSTATGQVTGTAYGGTYGNTANSLNISYEWKLHSDANYTAGQDTYTQTIADGQQNYSEAMTFAESFDYQNQYDIRFTVSDLFSTATYTCQLMQGLPILSWDETEVDVFGNLHIHDRDNPTQWQDVMQGFDALMAHGSQQNLADFNSQTTTVQGITYKVSGDGTVKISGTATAYSSLNVGIFTAISGDTYILNGCPTGGGAYTFSVGVGTVHDHGNGAVVTGSGKQIIYVDVFNGETVDVTMHIMVRDARIAASEFAKPLLTTGYFTTGSVTVAANSSTSATATIVVPDGYRILAILRTWTNGNILVNYCSTSTFSSRWSQNGSNATATIWLRNPTSSSTSITASVEVLFIRA